MSSIAVPAAVPSEDSATFKRRFIGRMVAVITGGMLLDGYILGIIGPVTNAIGIDLGMSTLDMGLVAAAALFGILIGSPLGGWAADRIGRKPIFIINMGVFVVASAIQFFVDSSTMLFMVRLLMGIAIGAEYSVGWPLMSEFAPARLRGRLMGITVLSWFVGFMIGYTTGYVLNLTALLPWRVILGTSTFMAVILFAARIGLPESPRWLWSKGRKDEARAVARKYLQSVDDMADMEKECVRQGRFRDLFSEKHWRTTVFVSWFWFCNVMPYFAIATFAERVLTMYGLGGGLAGGIGLSMVAVAGVAVTAALIDKAGRRLFTVPPQWITVMIFLIIGLWSDAPLKRRSGSFSRLFFPERHECRTDKHLPRRSLSNRGARHWHGLCCRYQPGWRRLGHLFVANWHRRIRGLDRDADHGTRRIQQRRGVTALGTRDQGQKP